MTVQTKLNVVFVGLPDGYRYLMQDEIEKLLVWMEEKTGKRLLVQHKTWDKVPGLEGVHRVGDVESWVRTVVKEPMLVFDYYLEEEYLCKDTSRVAILGGDIVRLVIGLDRWLMDGVPGYNYGMGVCAHNLGHVFGAKHEKKGLMSEYWMQWPNIEVGDLPGLGRRWGWVRELSKILKGRRA